MFEAALKERFSELFRKFDPKLVFEIWEEILKHGGFQGRFPDGGWDLNLTIEQALDSLDAYCSTIESTILKRQEERKEGKERKGVLSPQKRTV